MRKFRVVAAAALLGGAVSPLLAAPAQAAELTTVTANTSRDGAAVKRTTAWCPSGTVVYGGGGNLVTPNPNVTALKLRGAIPVYSSASGRYGYSAAALAAYYPNRVPRSAWSLRVTALCGPKLPGYQLVGATSTRTDSYPVRTAQANCTDGRVPMATGGWVSSESEFDSNVSFRGTSVVGYRVFADATETPAGSYQDWHVISRAVCVTKPDAYTVVTDYPGNLDRSPYKGNNTPACPTGTRVYGGGGSVTHNPGDPHLLQFETARTTRWQSQTAYWDQTSPTYRPWTVYAFAFCAR